MRNYINFCLLPTDMLQQVTYKQSLSLKSCLNQENSNKAIHEHQVL